jgi:acid phosphatase (class A)
VFSLGCASRPTVSAGGKEYTLTYLRPDAVDVVALLPPPPTPDSLEQTAELELIERLQRTATPADEARAKDEGKLSVFRAFAPVLGPEFTAERLPRTALLFDAIAADSKFFSVTGKDHWKRPRPTVANDRLQKEVAPEKEASYPSGHAARGMMFALVLAEVVPDRRPELLARGEEIGFDRVIAAVHYPSDVVSGRTLGQALARELMRDSKFRAALDDVRAEIRANRERTSAVTSAT